MGSAERMKVAAGIIADERKKHPVVVVVSAMSKVTDLLLETLRRAEVGDRTSVETSRDALLKRHIETCEQLLEKGSDACKAVSGEVQSLASEFQRIAGGVLMLGERPPRSVDEAIAVGERLSALILARYLDQTGTKAHCGECRRFDCDRCHIWERLAANGSDAGTLRGAAFAADRKRRRSGGDRFQWRNGGWPSHDFGPGRV